LLHLTGRSSSVQGTRPIRQRGRDDRDAGEAAGKATPVMDSLTPAYRRRLERGGVTRKEYESGASLSGARGHAATPERPTRADNKPGYAGYRKRQDAKPMHVVSTSGVLIVAGMTKADRSIVGHHLNAVKRYLDYGRSGSQLPSFKGKTVTGYTADAGDFKEPQTITLETNVDTIETLARSGALDFHSIYALAA